MRKLLQYAFKLEEASPIIASSLFLLFAGSVLMHRDWSVVSNARALGAEPLKQLSDKEEERLKLKKAELDKGSSWLPRTFFGWITNAYYIGAIVIQTILTLRHKPDHLHVFNACMMLMPIGFGMSATLLRALHCERLMTPKYSSGGELILVSYSQRRVSWSVLIMAIGILFSSFATTWYALWPGVWQSQATLLVFSVSGWGTCVGLSKTQTQKKNTMRESMGAATNGFFVELLILAIFYGRVASWNFGYDTGFGHVAPWLWLFASLIMLAMAVDFIAKIYRYDHHLVKNSAGRTSVFAYKHFWTATIAFTATLLVFPAITIFEWADFNFFNFGAMAFPVAQAAARFALSALVRFKGSSEDIDAYSEEWPIVIAAYREESSDTESGGIGGGNVDAQLEEAESSDKKEKDLVEI